MAYGPSKKVKPKVPRTRAGKGKRGSKQSIKMKSPVGVDSRNHMGGR